MPVSYTIVPYCGRTTLCKLSSVNSRTPGSRDRRSSRSSSSRAQDTLSREERKEAGVEQGLVVENVAGPAARAYSTLAGLPDDAFQNDGQLTKRDVRAVTLARLAPLPGELLWDVGAGCGSISIEWMRTHPACRAIAIEADAGRQQLIRANAEALGVPGQPSGQCAKAQRSSATRSSGASVSPTMWHARWFFCCAMRLTSQGRSLPWMGGARRTSKLNYIAFGEGPNIPIL